MASVQNDNHVVEGIVGALCAFAAWVVERAPTAVDWALQASRECIESARCLWAVGMAACRVAMVQRFMNAKQFTVYKVLVLNEDEGTDCNITKAFNAKAWEESARVASGWHSQRIRTEVRYVAHGKKYRLVLRPGNACQFPDVPERHRGGPKGVMAAELVGEEATVNITRRVLKYQGPMKDFHRHMGLHVSITDMFPFDDASELVGNFHTLRVVDARAHVIDLPIACADVGSSLASDAKTD